MKYLLLPFSWLYGLAIIGRNLAFDIGILRSVDVGVPVISVGNMTMGGTGKTPLVEQIVNMCLGRNRRVAVVSRGYRRKSQGVVVVSDGHRLLADASQGGDEPVQIARKYPMAVVVVGERRVDAARKAVELKADVIVLDDGFQHRYLHRDLDIVVLDSRKDLFRTSMIPAGERREPLGSIRRGQLLALSRVDESSGKDGWLRQLNERFRIPKVSYRHTLDRIRPSGSDGALSAWDLKGRSLLVFSGIVDHQGFVEQMKRAGLDIVADCRFPDHHVYTGKDTSTLLGMATQKGAEAFLTTEKDFVRLSSDAGLFKTLEQRFPLYSAGITVDITQGRELLETMIDKCLRERAS
jgi:tetraacyldisaccharide 4'-kinase